MREARFAREWASYRKEVLPEDAGEIQLRETEFAFYCGAVALFTLTMSRCQNAGPEPTPADMRFMKDLEEELREFSRRHGAI